MGRAGKAGFRLAGMAFVAAACVVSLIGPATGGTAAIADAHPTLDRRARAEPFAQVMAPCLGDDGVIAMRSRRSTDGGTVVTSRLQRLDHPNWFGGMYVGFDSEQPSDRFRAVRRGFSDATKSPTRWGTPAIGLYTSHDDRASCVVNIASSAGEVIGGADYIGLTARLRRQVLRLHAQGAHPNRNYGLRVRLVTTNGVTVTKTRRVRSDNDGFINHTMHGVQGLGRFTRIRFTATSTGRDPDLMWTVISRGRG